MFQIVRLALDDNGEVNARRPLQPLFELREDAMAMAEFDASRLSGDYGCDDERDGLVGKPTRADANTASSSSRSPPPTPRREIDFRPTLDPASERRPFCPLIPAQAGIQSLMRVSNLDPRFRGDERKPIALLSATSAPALASNRYG